MPNAFEAKKAKENLHNFLLLPSIKKSRRTKEMSNINNWMKFSWALWKQIKWKFLVVFRHYLYQNENSGIWVSLNFFFVRFSFSFVWIFYGYFGNFPGALRVRMPVFLLLSISKYLSWIWQHFWSELCIENVEAK